jgi:nucleoside-diphosphate-sugar epimerase
MSMTAAVIGASGFIGRILAQMLANAGHTVYCLDRAPVSNPQCVCLPYDALHPEAQFPSVDAVFYLAQSGYYRAFPAHAEDLFGVNVLGAIKAAQAAQEAGCRFFCYASTGSVYAPSFTPMTETFPVSRTSPYELSKLMAEEALDCFSPWMLTTSVRIFGAYGPGQKAMLPYAIKQRILANEAVSLASSPDGDADGLRISFIYAEDLAWCLLRLAEKSLAGEVLPQRINLAGPEGISLRQLATNIADCLGRQASFIAAEQKRQKDLLADISVLRALLQPDFTPFAEGIRLFCVDC